PFFSVASKLSVHALMKQPPESLSVRKGGGDMSSDPALLMDKAAAQLAATLQDGALQKVAGHSHNNHSHERLKDLTSRVLNGDQDALPKLCAPEPPMLKGAEAPATNGTHQHNCTPDTEHELKVMIPQVVEQPLFEPCCANGTSLATATEGTISGPEKRKDSKKRRGGPHNPNLSSSVIPSDLIPELTQEDAKDSPLLIRFSVGDLVWTKVSGYPWWPCMVTTDPEFNNHIKPKQKGEIRSGLLYHVQYFGDAPERGYIFEKNMVSFTGEDQYQELSQGNKPPTAPSVPLKLQAQWNMGIIQAKEAFSMSLDERVVNFTFLYDDDGPHLNPCILEKLKPQQKSNEMDQETESRLSSDLHSPLVGPTNEPTAAPQSQDSTSTGKKTQDPTTSAPDLQAESVVAQKKKRRPRQAQPSTKTVRRRKKTATDNTSDAGKKRKSKLVSSTDNVAEAISLPVSLPGWLKVETQAGWLNLASAGMRLPELWNLPL
uniref:PWWP domain-containing protein n=1 Tax=Sander lucioperca TaxID=283035 RepID=A0A8D0DAX0_SANLU